VASVARLTTANAGTADASATIAVRCPNVVVVKHADPAAISAGDDAVFRLTVDNRGEGAARSVQLSDPLPAGVTWSEDEPDCQIAAGTLSCSFGSLAAGAARTVTVRGATDAADCGALPNTATASASNEAAADTADNSGSAELRVDCPDLRRAVAPVPAEVLAGEPASLELTVTNAGAGIARAVQLSDALPPGIAWSTSTAGCAVASGVLACTLGDLASGAARKIVVAGATDAGDCGTVTSVATATAANQSAPAVGAATLTVTCAPSDAAKPACAMTGTGTDAFGRRYIEVTVEDDQSGLARIDVLKSTNADTVVPAFQPGTTDPVVVRATKVLQTTSSTIELRATDVAGNATVCDPVVALQVREAGRPVTARYDGLPQAESKVLVENGDPGVNRLDVTVNGVAWKLTGLGDGEQRRLDVAAAMRPGEDNVVEVTAYGRPGASALVVISD
jgi:uncharacterized repeat protein (TIGR01451 family)